MNDLYNENEEYIPTISEEEHYSQHDNIDFEAILAEHEEYKNQSKMISSLEDKVVRLEEKICEERFCWILCVIILLNVFFFEKLNSSASAISLVLLQIILLIIIARRLGVEDLTNILDKYVLSNPLNPIKKKN